MFRGSRSREDLTLTGVNEEFASILYILIPIWKKSVTELCIKCYWVTIKLVKIGSWGSKLISVGTFHIYCPIGIPYEAAQHLWFSLKSVSGRPYFAMGVIEIKFSLLPWNRMTFHHGIHRLKLVLLTYLL